MTNTNYYGETVAPPKKPMSLWWPMGMLIAWVVAIAVGAGLIGASVAQYSNCIGDAYSYYSSSSLSSCDDNHTSSPMFIAGAVFVVIGGICHLLFWILLIVWFVKRSNARRAQNVYITQSQQPATTSPGYNNAYQGQGYPQQQYQQPHYQQQAPQPGYKA